MTEQTEDSKRSLKTVETSWRIIRDLDRHGGGRVSELAREYDCAKSTIHEHLSTLQKCGIVTQQKSEYRLSLELTRIGDNTRADHPLYQTGKVIVDQLANDTEEYVHLIAREGTKLVYLHGAGGRLAIGQEYFKHNIKDPMKIHVMASSKAILAYLDEEELQAVLENLELTKYTENTITDEQELRDRLEQIRERGFALNDEEELIGARAVGTPIFSIEDRVVGSLSLTKPKGRMSGTDFREKVPRRVMSAANGIEAQMSAVDLQ